MKTNFNIIWGFILFSYMFLSCQTGSKENEQLETSIEKEASIEAENNIITLTNSQMKTVGIEIGNLEEKVLDQSLKVNGVLRVPNSDKANATSLFGGVIKTMHIEIGDYVNKGQVIATISNPQFIQLQEEYLNINSRIVFAEQEVSRQNELHEGNAGAKKNLQSATSELNTLSTRKASLQKQLEMMGISSASLSNNNLKSSLTVKSPISGTVSNVFSQIGSYVDVSSPIIEVVANNALILDLHLYEKDIELVKVGQKIDFIITNNPEKNHTAEVINIGSTFSSGNKTIVVRSKVLNNKEGLIDGMHVTGLLYGKGTSTPAVPNEAIVNTEGKNYIFIVHEKNKDISHKHNTESDISYERVEVIAGTSALGYTAITPLKELSKAIHVVVKGAFFVNAKMNNSGESHDH